MIAPRADTIFEPRDKLILLANKEGFERLSSQLDPW
jgi:Trk K+ transport system NAD-binding subunit